MGIDAVGDVIGGVLDTMNGMNRLIAKNAEMVATLAKMNGSLENSLEIQATLMRNAMEQMQKRSDEKIEKLMERIEKLEAASAKIP